jgi:hypothetical protein
MSRSSRAWPVRDGSEFSLLNVRYLRNLVSMMSGDGRDGAELDCMGWVKSGIGLRRVGSQLNTRNHLVMMRGRYCTSASKARLRLKDA